MQGRVLAVDPGSKRIGLAISDPMRIIASPLAVIKHISMTEDCERIREFCSQNEVSLVILGYSPGGEGEENAQMRHSLKLAERLKEKLTVPVELWDETGSTQQALLDLQMTGRKKKERSGHQDDFAAAVILQTYLDAKGEEKAIDTS